MQISWVGGANVGTINNGPQFSESEQLPDPVLPRHIVTCIFFQEGDIVAALASQVQDHCTRRRGIASSGGGSVTSRGGGSVTSHGVVVVVALPPVVGGLPPAGVVLPPWDVDAVLVLMSGVHNDRLCPS
jgi:hypothetical protein